MQHGIDEYAAIVLVVTACEEVLHAFRALVPEEAHDVAAVLSADLRAIW